MRIGLVTARPGHPLLVGAAAALTPRHEVLWVDPERGGQPGGDGPPADVYLLKARTPAALAVARRLEKRGAPVLNTASATELCQDRVAMAELARAAGLPFAATEAVSSLARLAHGPAPRYPLVVKSRHSRRKDLVARVDGPGALRALLPAWRGEPVVVQPFTANSGWDHKLWVIGGRVFAALRRSELADDAVRDGAVRHNGPRDGAVRDGAAGDDGVRDGAAGDDGVRYGAVEAKVAPCDGAGAGAVRGGPLAVEELPAGWAALALRVGEVFALDVYGVDLIDAGGGAPKIVDVNAFPGARGQAGAPEALAALALRAAREGAAGPRAWRRLGTGEGPCAGRPGSGTVEYVSPRMPE